MKCKTAYSTVLDMFHTSYIYDILQNRRVLLVYATYSTLCSERLIKRFYDLLKNIYFETDKYIFLFKNHVK